MLNGLKRVIGAKLARLALLAVLATTLVTTALAGSAYYSCYIGAIEYDCYCNCGTGSSNTGSYDCTSINIDFWGNCWLTTFGCTAPQEN
jgi:uncharacterized membrane protein